MPGSPPFNPEDVLVQADVCTTAGGPVTSLGRLPAVPGGTPQGTMGGMGAQPQPQGFFGPGWGRGVTSPGGVVGRSAKSVGGLRGAAPSGGPSGGKVRTARGGGWG